MMDNLKTILITLTILVFLYAVAVSGAVWWVLSAKMSVDTSSVEMQAPPCNVAGLKYVSGECK